MPSWFFQTEDISSHNQRDPAIKIPINEIWKLREKLDLAICNKKWKKVRIYAKKIIKLLPLSIDKNTSLTGRVHLDGIYLIGEQAIDTAPALTKKRLLKLNKKISLAKKEILEQTKTKKKKKQKAK